MTLQRHPPATCPWPKCLLCSLEPLPGPCTGWQCRCWRLGTARAGSSPSQQLPVLLNQPEPSCTEPELDPACRAAQLLTWHKSSWNKVTPLPECLSSRPGADGIAGWACLVGWAGDRGFLLAQTQAPACAVASVPAGRRHSSARLRQTTPGSTGKDQQLPPIAPCLGTPNALQLPEDIPWL